MMSIFREYIKKLILLEKISREDFEDIEATARLAHMGQKRRDGTDYITHPLEVKDITERYYPDNYKAQILAMLHDSIEDGPSLGHVTEEELRGFIRGSISDPRDLTEIEVALDHMTHDRSKHPEYEQYISHVFKNKLAAIVKISDLIHNLSNNPSSRQVRKYKLAIQNTGIPGHIKRDHADELKRILKVTQ